MVALVPVLRRQPGEGHGDREGTEGPRERQLDVRGPVTAPAVGPSGTPRVLVRPEEEEEEEEELALRLVVERPRDEEAAEGGQVQALLRRGQVQGLVQARVPLDQAEVLRDRSSVLTGDQVAETAPHFFADATGEHRDGKMTKLSSVLFYEHVFTFEGWTPFFFALFF